MDKQKQAARNQKEDVVLNRTLIWFGGAVVVELLLLLLNRYYINYNVSGITLMSNIHKALPVMIAALAVLTVVCAVWLYTGLKKKRSGLIPGLLTGVFGALALGCLAAFRFKGAGIQLMCTLVPAVAVLALVYYLYQREFFAITVLSALGLVGLWLFRKAGGGHAVVVYGYFAVVAVIVLLALLSLGITNIHLGPTLPAFLSPNVTKVLVEKFGIGGISEVREDMKNWIQ